MDKKSRVNWFHLAGPSALKEYLTDELIPSMFLRALGITSVDGLPNKDLLFDVMEKRKNYIGRDTTNEIQTYLTQLDEQLEHTDDLSFSAADMAMAFNEHWGRHYGILFSLEVFLSVEELLDYITEQFEEVDCFKDEIMDIETLEEQVGMPIIRWYQLWQDAKGNELLTMKAMRLLEQVRY